MPAKKRFLWTRYLKAIVGFIAPVLTSLQTALGHGISFNEGARSALTGFITALVVWAVPNSQT